MKLAFLLLASLPALSQSTPASAPVSAPVQIASAPVSVPVIVPASEPAAVPSPSDALPAFDENAVFIFDGEKFARLEKTPFAVVGRAVFVTAIIIMKVPGSSSDTRVKPGMTPFLLIGPSTKGGQLVRLSVEHARNDPHRETRFVGEGQITNSDLVRFNEEKLPSGWHKITPFSSRPAEYAWVPFVGTHLNIIYDYGVDGSAATAK